MDDINTYNDFVRSLIEEIRRLNEKMDNHLPKRWLNRYEAAEYANMDVQTLDGLRNTLKLEFTMVGRRVIIDREKIDEYLTKNTHGYGK
ncbi:MAG: hypothetical protein RLO81_09655 [Fulvivirga sp.]|uniref:hypothetical protein n=1 Tax=Fulvivirga sp. TaxID=1931237 RepID=UPI0032F06A81